MGELPEPRLPRPLQAYFVWRHTAAFIEWCRSRLGDTFVVRTPPYGRLVYFSRPEDIKTIFRLRPEAAHAGEANQPLLEPFLGPRSLLVLDEDEHLRDRRLLLPHFHGDAVRRYGETFAEVAAAELDTWQDGERLRLYERMYRIALESILRTVFGLEEGPRLAALRAMLPRVVDIKPHLQLMWLRPELKRIGPWRRYMRTLEEADTLLREEISLRRDDPDIEQRTDVLSLLVQGSEERDDRWLRDELMTLLVAGHETTATGLAWAFERLMRTPAAMRRASEEIAGGDPDAYLDGVVKETLRARPVITDVMRILKSDTEIGGRVYPAGTNVLPGIALVHSSAAQYDEPWAFRPERFLGGSAESYAWIPFGGGTRRCIGAAFASLQMRVVLRTVLERVELEPPRAADERVRMRHVTSVPARGAEAVVRRRRRPLDQPGREPVMSGAT